MSPLDIQSGPVRAEAPPRAATAPPPEARPWSAADGGVGMAFGIFGLAALQAIPPAARWLTRPLAFALLVLWLLFMAAYLRAFLAGEAQAYLRPLVGRFAIGTWVADSAVTGEFLLYAAPGWRPVAMALAAIGLLVWVWYAKVALRGFARMLADPDSCRARGLILLTTVSIQALVLVALKLFPRVRLVAELATVPIGVGYVVYGLGAALVFHRFLRIGTWHLEEDWDDTNCILHGAVSISGLAAVSCPFFPDYLCLLSWAFAAAMVVLVEGVELARLAVRARLHLRHVLCLHACLCAALRLRRRPRLGRGPPARHPRLWPVCRCPDAPRRSRHVPARPPRWCCSEIVDAVEAGIEIEPGAEALGIGRAVFEGLAHEEEGHPPVLAGERQDDARDDELRGLAARIAVAHEDGPSAVEDERVMALRHGAARRRHHLVDMKAGELAPIGLDHGGAGQAIAEAAGLGALHELEIGKEPRDMDGIDIGAPRGRARAALRAPIAPQRREDGVVRDQLRHGEILTGGVKQASVKKCLAPRPKGAVPRPPVKPGAPPARAPGPAARRP